MRMYIDWFDTERISTGNISIVGATAPHTSSSRGGIKLVYCTFQCVHTVHTYRAFGDLSHKLKESAHRLVTQTWGTCGYWSAA